MADGEDADGGGAAHSSRAPRILVGPFAVHAPEEADRRAVMAQHVQSIVQLWVADGASPNAIVSALIGGAAEFDRLVRAEAGAPSGLPETLREAATLIESGRYDAMMQVGEAGGGQG